MTTSQRIKVLIEALGVSVLSFEKTIDVPRGRINKAISKDYAVTVETITAIVEAYPQVNKNWLLTGEGDMFNKPAKSLAAQALSEEQIDYLLSQPNTGLHEGQAVNEWLKRQGYKMTELAEDTLGFKYQNLTYHLRKDKLAPDFRRLLEEKLGIDVYRDILSSPPPDASEEMLIRQKINNTPINDLMFEIFQKFNTLGKK